MRSVGGRSRLGSPSAPIAVPPPLAIAGVGAGTTPVWTNLGEIGIPDVGAFNWKPTTREVVGGLIYSGYYSCSGGSGFYAFDIGTGMWSTRTATTSVGGTDAIIGVHGTELVLIEQDTAGANRTKPYDIGTDTWGANRAAYAGNGGGHGAYGPSMCQSGNLIYLISGEATTGTVDSGNNSLETWVYDMGADTWTRLHDLDVGFWSAGCDVGADGLIYCIGGTRDAAGPGFEGIVRVYDPGSDTWDTTRAAPPLPPITGALQFLNFPALAGLPDGRLLYGGGIPSDGSDTGAFWLYDPGTDTFTPTTDSSTASNMSWSILDLGNDAPAKNGNDIYVGSGAWSSFAKFTL